MTPLPILRGPCAALFPFTQTYTAITGVQDTQNGATTRWVKAPPLVQFQLPFMRMTQAQKNTFKASLVSAKGEFFTTWSLTTDQTYNNLSLDSDEFSAAEQNTTRYNAQWTLTQVMPQSFSPGASGGAYPTLSTGMICQLVYTQKERFQTIVSKVDSGAKYVYAEFGAGLTNFPTGGLMAWEFDEQNLTDAEVTTKVAHFLANWGNCFPFTFTDEDGTTYSNVYYGSPQLVITRQQFNMSSIHTVLIGMNS